MLLPPAVALGPCTRGAAGARCSVALLRTSPPCLSAVLVNCKRKHTLINIPPQITWPGGTGSRTAPNSAMTPPRISQQKHALLLLGTLKSSVYMYR